MQQRADRLVELNVLQQVKNLAKTSIVQQAWKKHELELHGWVFDIRSGKIIELDAKFDEIEDLDPIFKYAD